MPLDNSGNRLDILLYSLAVGLAVGVIYTVFRLIYSVVFEYGLGKKTGIILRFILDILFSLLYNLIAVIFVFGANSGVVRSYILFFAVVGFVLYELTLGRFIYGILLCVLKVVVRISKRMFYILCLPFRLLLRNITHRMYSSLIKKYVLNMLNGGIG